MNNFVFKRTNIILTSGSAKLVITVKAIIPKISSIIAAPSIDVPTLPLSFPISLSVSTVILTDVAVNTTPIKTDSRTALSAGTVFPKNT